MPPICLYGFVEKEGTPPVQSYETRAAAKQLFGEVDDRTVALDRYMTGQNDTRLIPAAEIPFLVQENPVFDLSVNALKAGVYFDNLKAAIQHNIAQPQCDCKPAPYTHCYVITGNIIDCRLSGTTTVFNGDCSINVVQAWSGFPGLHWTGISDGATCGVDQTELTGLQGWDSNHGPVVANIADTDSVSVGVFVVDTIHYYSVNPPPAAPTGIQCGVPVVTIQGIPVGDPWSSDTRSATIEFSTMDVQILPYAADTPCWHDIGEMPPMATIPQYPSAAPVPPVPKYPCPPDCVGPQGPAGERGPQGNPGSPGLPGPTGPAGPQGSIATYRIEPFDPSTVYGAGSIISDGGNMYQATVQTVNQDPFHNPDIWQLIVSRGETGLQGPQGEPGLPGLDGINGLPGEPGPPLELGFVRTHVSDDEHAHVLITQTGLKLNFDFYLPEEKLKLVDGVIELPKCGDSNDMVLKDIHIKYLDDGERNDYNNWVALFFVLSQIWTKNYLECNTIDSISGSF